MNESEGAVRIKICGITNVEDARCVANAGADFLGFVFYPKSPRYVTPEQAAAITQNIRDEWGPAAPRFVGVFVDAPVATVQAVLASAGLDLAQLHGDEPPADLQCLAPKAFKAIRLRAPAEAKAAVALYREVLPTDAGLPQLLVDAYDPRHYGGTGNRADWAGARLLAGHCRLLLAGGLGPETVGAAVELVGPWGVDVSSGVERCPGLKDHRRVHAFVRAVRAAGGSA